MKIFVLTENYAGNGLQAEHGLSYYVLFDNTKVLFDSGQSDLFLKNASAMKIDLSDIDFVVLSHGHFDHGNGLVHLPGGKLVCHPDCFVKRYRSADHTYIGLNVSKEDALKKFDAEFTSRPVWLTHSIVFLGEIPRITSFESKITAFTLENGDMDFVVDDSALVFLLKSGLFIITGCGHAGIVNTIEYATKVTGIERVAGIMGGFHLKEINLQTRNTINYLKSKSVRNLLPAHCTALPVIKEFSDIFGGTPVKTGDYFYFN